MSEPYVDPYTLRHPLDYGMTRTYSGGYIGPGASNVSTDFLPLIMLATYSSRFAPSVCYPSSTSFCPSYSASPPPCSFSSFSLSFLPSHSFLPFYFSFPFHLSPLPLCSFFFLILFLFLLPLILCFSFFLHPSCSSLFLFPFFSLPSYFLIFVFFLFPSLLLLLLVIFPMSSSPHSHLQFPLPFLFPIFLLFLFPLFPSLCIPPTPPIPFPSHLFLSPPPHILFMPVLLSPLFLPLLAFLSNRFSSFFPSPYSPPPFLFISLVLLLDPYFPPSSQRVWPFHNYGSFFHFQTVLRRGQTPYVKKAFLSPDMTAVIDRDVVDGPRTGPPKSI